MNPLCIYHKNCADGFGAALAVKIWADNIGITVDFLPAHYGDPIPEVKGRDVYIVDFSYPRDVLLDMKAKANTVTVLDHHKTAEQELKGLDFCKFDMNKSGAVLTWEHFNPSVTVPDLFLYIQDRDLWKWELPFSKEVSAGLQLIEMSFNLWSSFVCDVQPLIETGSTVLHYQNGCVDEAVKQAYYQKIAGYTVPCVNATHLVSEIGNELAKGHPFAAMYFDTEDKRVYSLRSAKDGIDVGEIAKRYGGGGHKHAAGFTITKPEVTFLIHSYL